MPYKLKAWLKPNKLTPDPTDFHIVIDSMGSVGPKDIIKELVAEGMELKPETVLDVITRYNRKSVELTFRGYNVNNGVVYMRPVVKGVAYDKTWNTERNRLYVSIRQGTELKAAVADTKVEIMGEHPDPIAIYSVNDLSTGNTDGTLTRGFNAELKGTYIKITGDDPACGIYFKNTETEVETKLDARYISVNDPSRLMIIVPATMDAGTYEMRITTQYSNSKNNLKNPRSVTLSYLLEFV